MFYQHVCGCWFIGPNYQPTYPYSLGQPLPQIKLRAHTSILVTTSRTKLYQTFLNDTDEHAKEVQYTFPLYDGVSVVSFKCTINGKVILGIVKEREEARARYEDAVAQGKSAGLFEQSLDASDVFTTRIGNIPSGAEAEIEIEYIGELKHDAELDGVRFTIPTSIAPRYGGQKKLASRLGSFFNPLKSTTASSIEISVDVMVEEGAHIEGLTSPSHPIAMKLGRTSTHSDQFRSNLANATLALGSAELDKDFVVVVHAQGHEIPRALLERHPSIPNHRALMATLVPKFNLPTGNSEIVFVVDRSGSMNDKMALVNEALRLFLRSLPYSAKFNIISFGSHHEMLFKKSMAYDEQSAQTALDAVQQFHSNMGGTEMLAPLQAAVKNRLSGVPLEIMLLTDGQVWNQQPMFDFINEAAKRNVRLFSLGIGDGASTAQVEGLARAGNGFAQFAKNGEKVDKRLMRMLKAALSPHIEDYHLEVAYSETSQDSEGPSGDDDFEMIEDVALPDRTANKADERSSDQSPTPISLIDANFTETTPNLGLGRYGHLPTIKAPKELQAPCKIGGLFSFNRTSVYLLLADSHKKIKSVALVGSFNGTPLRLDIPVQDVGVGQTIHQLAAKKAMLETEEGRGWLSSTTSAELTTLRKKHEADWSKVVEREAARLGTRFQVAGKFCSFVAIEQDSNGQQSAIPGSMPSAQDLQPPAYQANYYSPAQFGGMDNFRKRAAAPSPMVMSQAPQMQQMQQMQHMGTGPIRSSAGDSVRRSEPTASAAFSFLPPKHSRSPAAQSQPFLQAMLGQAPAPQSAPPARFGATYTAPAYGIPETHNAFMSLDFSPVSSFGAPDLSEEKKKRNVGASARFRARRMEKAESKESKTTANLEASQDAMDVDEEAQKPNASAAARFRARRKEKVEAKAAWESAAQETPKDTMHALTELQRFDGSWQLTAQLLKLTGVESQNFKSASVGHDDEGVKATLLALAWLEKKRKEDKEIWEMIADKARNWLGGQQGVDDVDELLKRAVDVFFP